MKKKLFLGLLAAAAVSFTACQKDEVLNEVQQDNAIGFGTYVGRDAQTKALEATGETIKSGFGVFAYYTGNTDYPESPETNTTYAPSFMNNEKVWYNVDKWDYTNKKYWPGNSQKVSFFAYAPYVSAADAKITALPNAATAGDPTIGFTVPATVSDQIDLLYATPVKNASSGTVAFAFNHALSRIGFKVKTDRTDYKITINSITVSGKFNTSGTLNLNSGLWPSRSVAKDNNSNEIATDYIVSQFNDHATDLSNTSGLDITKDGYYIMVIPTTLNTNENNVSVTVNYNYAYKVLGGSTAETSDDFYAQYVENITTNGSVIVDFAKGYAYTLVMTLDPLSPITFNVTSVAGWNEDHIGFNPGTDVTIQ